MTARRDPWQPKSLAEINAEFSARARWWRSPEGIAHRKALDEFYASEDERAFNRMAWALIVECSRCR